MAWASYVVGGKNFTANFDGGWASTNYANKADNSSPTDGTDRHRWLGCAGILTTDWTDWTDGRVRRDINNGLNGLNGFGRFVFNRLRLNMCCCVLRRQDTSATDGCSENPINQINPLWKNILLGCAENPINQINPLWKNILLGCAGIEQRIKSIERVPAAWDF